MSTYPTGRIEALFHEVVDLTPARRAIHLREQCGSDLGLQGQVESLVSAHEHVTAIFGRVGLSAPACADSIAAAPSPVPSHPRYAVTREIGRGGMGVVYLATDLQLGRPVALKCLHASVATDAAARERLVAEARAAAMLDHPNVATIYEVGQSAEGHPFIAMAYCPGESLRARLQRGPIPVEQAVHLMVQAAQGIGAAHGRGLLHRDIKPANLLLGADDSVKVVDFGIASRMEPDHAGAGGIAGTIAYMSPEQARGMPLDPRTDIWSLGVVLHEMLTGRRAFAGNSSLTLLLAILHQPPAAVPREISSAGALQRVLDRALSKDRSERLTTTEEFIRDLLQAAASGHATPAAVVPTYLTSFIGRQRETDAARAVILAARLVTLTGPPGTGKTRLAVHLASVLRPAFPGGQFVVHLAPVDDPLLVPSTIAQTLGLRGTGHLPVLEAIQQHLGQKRVVLILDNFEHVLFAAPVVAQLVSSCPGLTVVATSRAPLGIAGEHEFRVPPLECPASGPPLAAEEIAHAEAVSLFSERARAMQPSFVVDARNAETIAAICRRLDCLPLAIELAAVRIKLLSPEEILNRLENPLDLLNGGASDAPSRHRTLRQAIAWSHALLPSSERKVLRRLAVFAGSYSLEAAEFVGGDVGGTATLDSLTSLVDNNLLVHHTTPGQKGARFGMLETVREFALESLRAASEEAETRAAHAAYYLRVAEASADELTGARQAEYLEGLDADCDNLRGALEWSLAAGHTETAAGIVASLWRYWLVRGQLLEGAHALERVLAAGHPHSARRQTLFKAAGTLAHNLGNYAAAREYHEQAVSLARSLTDQRALASSLTDLGWVAWRQGDYALARTLSVESLELHTRLDDAPGVAHALNNLGWIAHHEGSYAAAAELHRQALAIRQAASDPRAIGFSQVNLAWALVRLQQLPEANRRLRTARALLEKVGERQLLGFVDVVAAESHCAGGEPRAALALLNACLGTFRRLGDRYGIATTLARSAMAAAQLGDRTRALKDAEEALGVRRQIGDRWGQAESLCTLGHLAAATGQRRDALAAYRDAISIWNELGDRAGLAKCLAFISAELGESAPLAAAQLGAAADRLRTSCDDDWSACMTSPTLNAARIRALLEDAGISIPQVLELVAVAGAA